MASNEQRSRPATLRLTFPSAAEAARPVGGVALAARAAAAAEAAGAATVFVHIGDPLAAGAPLPPTVSADIHRACPDLYVVADKTPGAIAGVAEFAWHEPALADIVRATSKSGDGVISRHINRPISQAISSWLLAHAPWVRPMHVTLFVAAFGAMMVASMLLGGWLGFIAGGVLFHFASILDGVDGELARATWRSSRLGAIADSVTDQAINLAFFVSFTVGVDNYYGEDAQEAAGWAVALFIAGLMIMLTLARLTQSGGSLNFLKNWYRQRFPDGWGRRLTEAVIACTSRDFIAFIFAVTLVLGLGGVMPYLLLGFAGVWLALILWAAPALLHQAGAGSAEVEIPTERAVEKSGNIHIGE